MKEEHALLPCPLCGSEAVMSSHTLLLENDYEDRYRVECLGLDCGISSAEFNDETLAAESWNRLPRTMAWTTKTPTKSGWYWVRPKSSPNLTMMHYVTEDEGKLCVDLGDCDYASVRRYGEGKEWSGPIHEPIREKRRRSNVRRQYPTALPNVRGR